MSGLMQSNAALLGDVLAAARERLAQAGIKTAAQEAAWLLEQALGCRSHQLVSDADRVLSPAEQAAVSALIERRARREPLQYILGTQEFCGLEFSVSPAVLIPRPETELLVSEVVRQVRNEHAPIVVDVGTGSGCVAVTVATILGRATVVAIDCSAEALRVATDNAARHGVAHMIEWCEGDLLAPLAGRGWDGRVAVIVSNPPYIADAELAGLQPEVRDFEPKHALVSGPGGTEYHRRLLCEARRYLAPGGVLMMEMGQGQAEAVRALAHEAGGYAPVTFVEDAAGIDRVVVAQRLGEQGH